MPEDIILEVEHLKKYFPVRSGLMQSVKGYVKAVDDISFTIRRGKTLGLVGESGCGKTTAGRTILRLNDAQGGRVLYEGQDIFQLSKSRMRALRTKLQMIFQDPYSSLSPRMPVGEIIGEGVREHGIVGRADHLAYVQDIMEICGLRRNQIDLYPHEFSGGQRQRIGIARALALNPRLIVCDEPVSALDVSIQAQIINLMMELQQAHGIAYLFISHDLSVIEHISDDVGVMYLGSIVEMASKEELFSNPLHPYTQAMFSAIPVADPLARAKRIILSGDLPSPVDPPAGCKFHTRCPQCMERCKTEAPAYRDAGAGHFVACHLVGGARGETGREKA